ncbi:MAG: hypothetical protein EOP10_26690, partial [Proteobacteria bacterium]
MGHMLTAYRRSISTRPQHKPNNTTPNPMINSDKAKKTIADDKLELAADFIPRLAKITIEWPSEDGIVVGIFGPWGIGKTTILNMLESYTKISTNYSQAIIAPFSPWFYSDDGALITSFFSTIAQELGKEPDKPWREKAEIGLKAMGSFLTVASKGFSLFGASLDLEQVKKGLDAAASTAKESTDLINSLSQMAKNGEQKLRENREAVASALKELGATGGRLLIFLDDIDRLNKNELFNIFRLIRTIKELPYTTIILAMDESRVRDILRTATSEGYGSDYLEKIIQIPIHIPLPSFRKMAALLSEELKETFSKLNSELPAELTMNEHYTANELSIITRELETPRDLARYINSIKSLLLAGNDPDLNPTDAALIEALHTFHPDVYDRVRRNPSFFTERHEYKNQTDINAARELTLNRIIRGTEQQTSSTNEENIREILSALFGDLTRKSRSTNQTDDRVKRRIRSPEYFGNFFRYSATKGRLSTKATSEAAKAIINCAKSSPPSS